MMKCWIFLSIIFICFTGQNISPLIVGSKTSPSSQAFTIFPSIDTNNTLLGFSTFEQGFMLEDSATSCTYNNYMPVSGVVDLRDAKLYLNKDFFLTNTFSQITSGQIFGNSYSFELPRSSSDFNLPTGSCFHVKKLSSIAFSNDCTSVDWSINDDYVAGVALDSPDYELKIAYFDGATLTLTLQEYQTRDAYAVRWHPTKRYLAMSRSSGFGNEIIVYEHKVHNGTLATISGASVSGNVNAFAWHPSGSYLIAGTSLTSGEIITYSASSTGVLSAGAATNLSPDRAVSRNALSFAPGGNKLVAGVVNNATTGAAELLVYSFNGSLTLTTSAEVGYTVLGVDWSPTGSYIAAGLMGGTTNLRIYDASSSVVLEVQSARQNISDALYSVQWDNTGTFLLVGMYNTGSTSPKLETLVYKFDKAAKTLTPIYNEYTYDLIYAARWSRSNNYWARGYYDQSAVDQMIVQKSTYPGLGSGTNAACPLIFDTTSLICNSDISVMAPVQFSGNCKVNGRGKRIYFKNGGSFLVRPNSNLMLEDLELKGIKGSNLSNLMSNGSITLRNCIINLAGDYTFSQGAILFQEDVVITGTNKFNYTSRQTSTIAPNAQLMFDMDVTFSYAPTIPNQNLLYMPDVNATLYLYGCTLHSTRTGLSLKNGTVLVDDSVTMSSEAKYPAESIRLDSNLNVVIKAGASLQLYGSVKYE